jgi:Domain of unknown function (DUF397)
MLPGHGVSEDADSSGRHWVKSSRSYGNGQCVEVAAQSGDRINVRDSQDPLGTVLRFSLAGWDAFVVGVRGGRFGL